jgi:hypothetical protein
MNLWEADPVKDQYRFNGLLRCLLRVEAKSFQ